MSCSDLNLDRTRGPDGCHDGRCVPSGAPAQPVRKYCVLTTGGGVCPSGRKPRSLFESIRAPWQTKLNSLEFRERSRNFGRRKEISNVAQIHIGEIVRP